MKKWAWVISGLLVFVEPSFAGIDLTWGACSSASTTGQVTFDCNQPDSTYRLVVSFQSPIDVPAVTGMRGRLVLITPSQCGEPLPFWHLETGGCNEYGVSMSIVRPPGSGACATPWWFTGAFARASYSYDPRNSDSPTNERYGVLDFAIEVDPFREPVSIKAGVNYYACHFDFSMKWAPSCLGCEETVGLDVQAILDGPDIGGVPLDGPGLRGDCAGVNGGVNYYCGTGAWRCSPTPTLPDTWGRLKSIYR